MMMKGDDDDDDECIDEDVENPMIMMKNVRKLG